MSRTMTDERISWKELTEMEPQLLILERLAREYKNASRSARYVCANDRWYGYGKWQRLGLREELIYLVGWCARLRDQFPRLRTSEAYDVAYHHIYELLPNCRNCGEIGS